MNVEEPGEVGTVERDGKMFTVKLIVWFISTGSKLCNDTLIFPTKQVFALS